MFLDCGKLGKMVYYEEKSQEEERRRESRMRADDVGEGVYRCSDRKQPASDRLNALLSVVWAAEQAVRCMTVPGSCSGCPPSVADDEGTPKYSTDDCVGPYGGPRDQRELWNCMMER
jgi:hypothetical protein